MGGSFSRTRDVQILMLGLDGAGKTSLINRKKGEKINDILPTIGFSVDKIKHKNLRCNMWDVGGQDSIRPLWKHYYSTVDALVYVVDATDEVRMPQSKIEFYKTISDSEMTDAKVLIVANKSDMADAKSTDEIKRVFDLDNLTSHQWSIVSTSAKSGEGIVEIYKVLDGWFNEGKSTKKKPSPT